MGKGLGKDSKLLDRAFNKAFSVHSEAEQQAQPRVKTPRDKDAELRELTASMDVSDAVSRMLLAQSDGDYFRLLELPAPEADALGRPVWACTPGDVSKAYRRLSVMVHPDKNHGEDARKAFEALNQAHKRLRDPGQLEELLNKAADTARRRRDAAEAAATPQERVALYASKKEEARALQQNQGDSFQAEIKRQMLLHQQRAKRKRDTKSSYRQLDADPAEDRVDDAPAPLRAEAREAAAAASDGSDEDGPVFVSKTKARHKARAIL